MITIPIGIQIEPEGREAVPWAVLRLGIREDTATGLSALLDETADKKSKKQAEDNLFLLQNVLNECMFSSLNKFLSAE